MAVSRTKKILNSIDSQTLSQAYLNAVSRDPNLQKFHNTNPDMCFLCWYAGIKSCIGWPQFQQYFNINLSGSSDLGANKGMDGGSTTGKDTGKVRSMVPKFTGKQTPVNVSDLPNNVRQAMTSVRSSSMRATG